MLILSWLFLDFIAFVAVRGLNKNSKFSITRSNLRKNGLYYKGELVFADEFNTFDLETWKHEITLGGNQNWEFQMYLNSRTNSFTNKGKLYLKPTLTSDRYGMDFVYNGQMDLRNGAPADQCTNELAYGCTRSGDYPHILNPIISSNIQTVDSFYFQYGRIEVRAKLPGGDWMWPGIWLVPRFCAYGSWPASGAIKIAESRGNQKLFMPHELWKNIGSELLTSSLQFGSYYPHYRSLVTETPSEKKGKGFDQEFHVYGLVWTDEYIAFTLDGKETERIAPPDGGFWEISNFGNATFDPWANAVNKRMAPFDQKFYFILNVAVGGTNGYFPNDVITDYPKGYFSDGVTTTEDPNGSVPDDATTNDDPYVNKRKPWRDDSDRAAMDFFEAIDSWYPTWLENGTMQVDWIRVYAV